MRRFRGASTKRQTVLFIGTVHGVMMSSGTYQANLTSQTLEQIGLEFRRIGVHAGNGGSHCSSRMVLGHDNRCRRTGTTLTEVLMSLLIMSIGIVSVATLFPISALRTLEANKQTNSAIASFNANAAIDARPELIHNPDDGIPESTSLFNIEPPATKYTSRINPVFGSAFRGTNYVVDPWGFYELLNPLNTEFGNIGGTTLPTFPASRRVRRFRAFLTDASQAALFVSQPDNWKLVSEDIAIGTTPAPSGGIHSVTLDTAADLSSVSISTTGPVVYRMYRAVIFNVAGTNSETRYVTSANPATNQVFWTEDVNLNGTLDGGEDLNSNGALDHYPLPVGFNSNVGQVRIDVADQVYSWMLTVRKASTGRCSVDAVVFFKRGFDPAFEQVYTADFRVNQFGAGDYLPTSDDLPDTADDVLGPNYRVRIVYTGDPPPVRRGSYVFDTSNSFWYRIRNVERELTEDRNANGSLDPGEDRNGNSTIDPTIDLIVDEPIRANNGNASGNTGGAILHPNVVNVFPLDNKDP